MGVSRRVRRHRRVRQIVGRFVRPGTQSVWMVRVLGPHLVPFVPFLRRHREDLPLFYRQECITKE